jgi:AraC family transcriptional regulator
MAQSYEARMLRVIDHIHHAPVDHLSLDELADVAAMSRFHFHRVFVALRGETAAQTVRRIRLFQAACALVQSDRSIELISARAGYANVPAFARAFRAQYDVPPGRFREQGQVRPMPSAPQKGETKMFDFEIKDLPDLRLASLPHKGEYTAIGHAFGRIAMICSTRGLWSQVEGMLGIYYDDPDAVAAEDLRSAAAVIIKSDTPCEDPLIETAVQGGRSAVRSFKGPYAGLREAY